MNTVSEPNGHWPLPPANQYCAYCGATMFSNKESDVACKNPRPAYFTKSDWAAEMELAREVSYPSTIR